MVIRSVEWPEGFHKSVHDVLYETARMAFIGLLGSKQSGQVFHNFFQLFVLVLRVRQSCCHGGLINEESRAVAFEVQQDLRAGTIDITANEGRALLTKLLRAVRGADSDDGSIDSVTKECAICFDELEEDQTVILRSCQHVFCEICLGNVQNQLCPLCRSPFEDGDMITKSTAQAATKRKTINLLTANACVATGGTSPKIRSMLDAINDMAKDEKAVIFSQWTSFLNIIQEALAENGHSFTRIDGTMNPFERIDAMEAFCSDSHDSPRFILCSLHACGTGINLTRGNVVFMMDCWWNVAGKLQSYVAFLTVEKWQTQRLLVCLC